PAAAAPWQEVLVQLALKIARSTLANAAADPPCALRQTSTSRSRSRVSETVMPAARSATRRLRRPRVTTETVAGAVHVSGMPTGIESAARALASGARD